MKNRSNPIYVELPIDATVETVWSHSQEPMVHQRWDVRFTEISYLPAVIDEPQRFVYATTVAPGLSVNGCGETLGERHRADGTAYSGLTFWSDHPLSLIKEGSGYWRYVPTADGQVRFLTRYDYRVRWGALGRTIDRYLFRPLFGWATAWSFDRLRLWIERGVSPERSRNRTILHAFAVVAMALIWAAAGVAQLLASSGLNGEAIASGIFGVAMSVATLRWWRRGWTAALNAVVAAASIGCTAANITLIDPVWLSLVVGVLAVIARLTRDGLPSGRIPLRAPIKNRSQPTQLATAYQTI